MFGTAGKYVPPSQRDKAGGGKYVPPSQRGRGGEDSSDNDGFRTRGKGKGKRDMRRAQ